MNRIRSIGDIKTQCSSMGMEPLNIISENHLISIQKFINHQLASYRAKDIAKKFIPIAYDVSQTSDPNKENKRISSFRPINGQKGYEIPSKYIEKDPLDFLDRNSNNKIFFGVDLFKNFKIFDIEKSLIMGVLCSTNKKNEINLEEWITLDCSSSPNKHTKLKTYSKRANFKIRCPSKCKNYAKPQNLKIFGDHYYSLDSSICLSAYHDGILTNEQGSTYLIVKIDQNDRQNSISGIERNGIESLDCQKNCERFFSIEKFKFDCPKKNLLSSSKSNSEINWNHMRFKEQKNNMAAFTKKMEIIDSPANDEDSNIEFKNEYMIRKMKDMFKSMKKNFKFFENLADELKNVTNEFYPTLHKQDLDPSNQENALHQVDVQLQKINDYMEKILILAQKKINSRQRRKDNLFEEKRKLLIHANFTIDFSVPIFDVWDVNDFKSDIVSNWRYKDGRILENSFAESKNNVASQIIIKDRIYYDFNLNLKFFSDGQIVFIFRYLDNFNFYMFEILKENDKERELKRFKLIKNGITKILKSFDDEIKFLGDSIFLTLHVQKENITISLQNESGKKNVTYSAYDGELVSGKIGIGIIYIYFYQTKY